MYRVITYYSLKGLIKYVDLGDSSYGEWIIYDNEIPKYHINIFDKSSDSNIRLLKLLENKQKTIESIVTEINSKENTSLSLMQRPVLEVIKTSELVNLDLEPIPVNWVSNISQCSF